MEQSKITFGIKGLENRTPTMAKNAFRITLLLTSIATFIIAGDAQINPELAVRIGVYLKALDLLVFGISKMFGVEVEEK
jgi:hypothetical protein